MNIHRSCPNYTIQFLRKSMTTNQTDTINRATSTRYGIILEELRPAECVFCTQIESTHRSYKNTMLSAVVLRSSSRDFHRLSVVLWGTYLDTGCLQSFWAGWSLVVMAARSSPLPEIEVKGHMAHIIAAIMVIRIENAECGMRYRMLICGGERLMAHYQHRSPGRGQGFNSPECGASSR